MYYKLKGKKTVKCGDFEEYLQWLESQSDMGVARSEQDGITISTVFLGLDHSSGNNKPKLFETMIFGGEHDNYQRRYETWEEAEHGHTKACDLAGIQFLITLEDLGLNTMRPL